MLPSQLSSRLLQTSGCETQLEVDDDCPLLEEEDLAADDDELRAEDEDETWHSCALQSVR